MIFEFDSVKDYLKSEFEFRIKKNSRYSLRSFAQFLQVNPAELSQVFNNQRKLGMPSAIKVAKAFGLNTQETKHLLWLLQSEKGKKLGLQMEFQENPGMSELDIETFAKLSSWYHFAILNLIDTRNFQWNAKYISRRISISQSEAQLAMDDLVSTGLVQIEEKANRILAKPVEVKSELPSHAVRKYHRQMLEKAVMALDEVSIEHREFQSIGFVTSPENIEPIKQDIRQFVHHIVKKYHKLSAKSVFQIQLCLFPISKENPNEK